MRIDPFSTFNQLFLTFCTRKTTSGIIINNHTQNAREIRMQIETFGRYFNFIHLDEIPQYFSRKYNNSRPFCLFTFDDGKQINNEAARELAKSGIPAVFYLVTDFIDSNNALWFDELRALKSNYPDAIREFDLTNPKSLPFTVLMNRLENAVKRYEVKADLRDPKVAPLTWNEVKALTQQGFVIGAHSTRHPILTNESLEIAKREIDDSIQKVSDMIGTSCTTFAFPNGNFSEDLIDYVRSRGIASIMTTEPLWVLAKHKDMYHLPRIQLFENHSEEVMLRKVSVARLGFVLRNPDGSDRDYIKRRFRPISHSS